MNSILQTERLTLRPYREADAAAIFELYATDREVTRFLSWCPHQDIEETRAFVLSRIEAASAGREFTWAITLADDTLVGSIALRLNGHKADFGYVIARPYWGLGYASEALRAVVDHALGMSGVYRVWGTCAVDNRASMRVMEKVGLQREGLLRAWVRHPEQGELPRDCWCFSVVKTASNRVNPEYNKACQHALSQVCALLNDLELEGRRVAGFKEESWPEEAAQDEWMHWLEAYRRQLWESWSQLLAAEHPLRLAGYSQAVDPLRMIVEQLETLHDRLDEDDSICTPRQLAEAVQDVFSKLNVIKTELYGWLA